ncbi:MAG: hypothetical protein J6P98_04050, partial [Clostridia bacterium]|nr:hypothetical protein [Clostridia bacterium]
EYYVGDERGAEVSFYDTESELLAKIDFIMYRDEGVWEYDDCFITMYGFDPLGEHYDREKLDSDLEALLLEGFTGEVTADTLEAEGYPATEGGAEQYVKDLIARSFTDCPEDNYFHCSEGLALLKERFGNTNVVILLHPDDIAPITTDNRIGSNGFYIEDNNYSWYSFPEVRSEYWGYFMLRRNVEITRNGDSFAYSVIDPFGKW